MKRFARYFGQVLLYGLFIGTIGAHSTSPPYRQIQPGQALLKLSVSHAGQMKTPCRHRSAEELEKLAPNMRTPMDCHRERSPVEVVLDLDGRTLYHSLLNPTGLAHDGISSVYRRFTLSSGSHRLRASLKDHFQQTEFPYTREGDINVSPGQVIVIDFNARQGGFDFR